MYSNGIVCATVTVRSRVHECLGDLFILNNLFIFCWLKAQSAHGHLMAFFFLRVTLYAVERANVHVIIDKNDSVF